MSPSTSLQGRLRLGQHDAESLAERFGTPLYVYDRALIESRYRSLDAAFSGLRHRICYAVKANSNLAVLQLLAHLGAGFDIVSGGELARVVAAGGDPGKVVFSGVGKTPAEIEEALRLGIHCFNVESEAELDLIARIASARGVLAPISLRVNPDVDAGTHPYISTGLRDNKFGIPIETALALYQHAAAQPYLRVTGIDCHIGSQLVSVQPFVDALQRVMHLVDQLAEHDIHLGHVDIGGGLGVSYHGEQPPSAQDYVEALRPQLQGRQLQVICEPGRWLVADAGTLLTRVLCLKDNGDRHFAVVDAAMNDLLRPALYEAWMEIRATSDVAAAERLYDVVGPVCESADHLGKDRLLRLRPGSLLAVMQAGAYGFAMSSNYNTRPRPAEVMVDADQAYLVRRRETLADLMQGESLLPLASAKE